MYEGSEALLWLFMQVAQGLGTPLSTSLRRKNVSVMKGAIQS